MHLKVKAKRALCKFNFCVLLLRARTIFVCSTNIFVSTLFASAGCLMQVKAIYEVSKYYFFKAPMSKI